MSVVLPHPAAAICSTSCPLDADLDDQASVNKRSRRSNVGIYHLVTLIHSGASDRKGRGGWEALRSKMGEGRSQHSREHAP